VPQPGIANGAGRRGDFLRQIDSPCGVRRVERRQGRFPRDRGGDTDLAWPRSCASRWPVAIPAGGQGKFRQSCNAWKAWAKLDELP